ncbi:MAG: DUF1801 domain-containing protein [Cyclobacteriaceae bacterium]
MARSDDIDEFLESLPKAERVIIQRLRSILFDVEPRLEEKMSYGAPFYKRNRMVCFIWPHSTPYGPRNALVSFGFCYGHMLSNDRGILLHEGRTQVYIVHYSSLQEIDEDFVRETLLEALIVDTFEWKFIRAKTKRKARRSK